MPVDELRELLRHATDALEAAGVPMEAPEARAALDLVIEAEVELRRLADTPWWRRLRVKRDLNELLHALHVEVQLLVARPSPAQIEVGPEFA